MKRSIILIILMLTASATCLADNIEDDEKNEINIHLKMPSDDNALGLSYTRMLRPWFGVGLQAFVCGNDLFDSLLEHSDNKENKTYDKDIDLGLIPTITFRLPLFNLWDGNICLQDDPGIIFTLPRKYNSVKVKDDTIYETQEHNGRYIYFENTLTLNYHDDNIYLRAGVNISSMDTYQYKKHKIYAGPYICLGFKF